MKSAFAKPPSPMLLGASLVFWGWQTKLWAFAVLMALILESAHLIRGRWTFSRSDFNRISDLCALLFIGIFAYLFLLHRSVFVIFTLLMWLPIIFFPLIFCQNYNTEPQIDIRTISLFFRKQKKGFPSGRPITMNLNYPYFALCILSTSFANIREGGFYLGLLLLSAWALWSVRSGRFSPVLWATMFVIACFGGYAGQAGLHNLQRFLEAKGMEWFYDLERGDADPYRSITALGYIGKLKLSDRILFRVRPETRFPLPLLLREAAYDKYNRGNWFALHSDFGSLHPESDGTVWPLGPEADKADRVRVSAYLRKGSGMLKLPDGAFQVRHLPVLDAERNRFGAVKVRGGPDLVNYDVFFGPSAADSHPTEDDLSVPRQEQPAIEQIVRELGLGTKSPEKALNTLAAFFEDNFSYSLELSPGKHPTPLADFLLRSRAGHCEYFATATVLLLRAAGVPARYVTGFSAHEYSLLDDWIVVRNRHAHAWASAFVNGSWLDVDNTASEWRGAEAEAAPVWQSLNDLWSWLVFKFSQWRWRENKQDFSKYIPWLFLPLAIIILRRLFRKKRIKTPDRASDRTSEIPRFGEDSDFYRIEKELAEMGYGRYKDEPLLRWIRRIENVPSVSFSTAPLRSILKLHYRYRFDPRGITPEERKKLRTEVEFWLARHKAGPPETPARNA